MLKAEDFDTLREARRKALYNVSDESLSEYLAYHAIDDPAAEPAGFV